MPTIIVSYRRSDSKWITGRIVDRLERDYGKDDVFVDIDAIPVGMDFRDHLRNVLDRCDVLLAIIGPNWLATDASGSSRISDPTDWVRVEIETALAKKIPVIPVLIDRAPMPKLSELPESMHSFAFRQAADLDTGRDFHAHMDRLVRAISQSANPQRPIGRSSEPTVAQRMARAPLAPSPDAQPQPRRPLPSPPKLDVQARMSQLPLSADAPSHNETPIREKAKKGEGRGRGVIAVIASAAVVLVIAAYLGHLWWDAPPPPSPRISDRIEQSGDPPGSPLQTTVVAPSQTTVIAKQSPAAAPVAPRVVLYEEDPAEPQGRRFVGSAIWRTERVSPGPGQPEEVAIRADLEIPDRKLALTWSLRRNTDQSLPASHTIEIMFRLPKDFAPGSIINVPGILMKDSENSRGAPLAGHAVKVTDSYHLIGLSSLDADRENNLRMLKERGWFDIPVVYSNKRRAILAVEKGTPGERAFAEAFAAWRQ